jgi:hypothetical protein
MYNTWTSQSKHKIEHKNIFKTYYEELRTFQSTNPIRIIIQQNNVNI